MTRTATLLLTLALLLSLAAADDQSPLQVHEVWVTTGSRATPFGAIGGMIEGPKGEIFVSDQINVAVFAIQPQGMGVRQVAREGRGPGEVSTPGLMAPTPNGGIALRDIGHNVILLLDGEFRETGRVQPEFGVYNPKGFAVLADTSFVLSGGSFRSGLGIHHFSFAGKHQASWLPAPEVESRSARIHLAGAPVAAAADGMILFTRPAPHLIAKLNPVTGAIVALAEDPAIIPAIGDDFEQRRMVDGREVIAPQWFYPQSRGIFELRDGAILNVITRRYDCESTFELYDANGRLESRHTVSKAYQPFALTRDGRILASYPDPQTEEPIAVLLELRRQ
jgi:hypothetical protein